MVVTLRPVPPRRVPFHVHEGTLDADLGAGLEDPLEVDHRWRTPPADDDGEARRVAVILAVRRDLACNPVPDLGRALNAGQRDSDLIIGPADEDGAQRFGMRLAFASASSLGVWELELIADRTRDAGLGGRVTVSHAYGFGQAWRRKLRPESERLRTLTDPHSPAFWRVNGPLSNMTEFRQAFGCKDGDAMVRAADKRAEIW